MPSHLVLQGFSMNYRYFSFAFFVLVSLILSSCGKYDPLNDKNVVLDRRAYDSSDKFTLTVYYNNPDVYYDMALNPYEIRDTFHSAKREIVLYRIVFENFMEGWFQNKPVIVNDKEEYKKKMGNIYTVCDIKNHRGDTLLWFTYDDPDKKEPYMILNGNLVESNELLLTFAKTMLGEPDNSEQFYYLKNILLKTIPDLTTEQKLELIKLLSK